MRDWCSDVCSSDLDPPSRHSRACSPKVSWTCRSVAPARPSSMSTHSTMRSSRRRVSLSSSTTRVTCSMPGSYRSEGDWGLVPRRSEEHTSELQSLMRISYAVFCLKKNTNHQITVTTAHTHICTHNLIKNV